MYLCLDMQRVNGEQEAGQAEEDAEELAATCAGAHSSAKIYSEKKITSYKQISPIWGKIRR